MKQALEAWQTSVYGSDSHHKAMLIAMTNMGQAIAEAEKQEINYAEWKYNPITGEPLWAKVEKQKQVKMPPYLNASYEGDDLFTGDQVRELLAKQKNGEFKTA